MSLSLPSLLYCMPKMSALEVLYQMMRNGGCRQFRPPPTTVCHFIDLTKDECKITDFEKVIDKFYISSNKNNIVSV